MVIFDTKNIFSINEGRVSTFFENFVGDFQVLSPSLKIDSLRLKFETLPMMGPGPLDFLSV